MNKQETILYKDARILWQCDKEGKIKDLIVAEFKEEAELLTQEERDKVWPLYLYKKYSFDIGNCNDWWNKTNPWHAFFCLFIDYDFSNRDIKIKALTELRKILEFRDSLDVVVKDYGICE